MDIFWGHYKIGLHIKGSFLCILGSFLKVKVQNGGYFFGLLKFQIFFLAFLKFPIFFGDGGVDAGLEPTYEENMRVPPPWAPGPYYDHITDRYNVFSAIYHV